MLLRQGAAGLQLDDKTVINQQVNEIIPNDSTVFIIYGDRVLLLHIEPNLYEPVDQCGSYTFSR
mgnify:CR=1 FL=1